MNGIINVYKERGYTSHDVVARLRGILKMKKIGHTGTLDPQAEGVLPVCVGTATKLCGMLTDKTKEYEAQMRLGVTTDTQDMTGKVLTEHSVEITDVDITNIMSTFVGKQEQIPPMYSALKVNGKRMYELAREGKEVERRPRPIEIYELAVIETALPLVRFRVSCSKGTYIRTLCHDIGQQVGCGACMESLKRTRVGCFEAQDARTLAEIERLRDEGRIDEALVPVEAMFGAYPAVTVSDVFRKAIDNGNSITEDMILRREEEPQAQHNQENRVRIYNEDGVFYGIYAYEQKERRYKPEKMFLDREQLATPQADRKR